MTKRLMVAAAGLRAVRLRALPGYASARIQASGGAAVTGRCHGQPGLAGAHWSFPPFLFGAGGRRDQPRAALVRSTTAMACQLRREQIVQEGMQS